jgi:hypothetical protein
MKLEIGKSYRLRFDQVNNPNNCVMHIRGIIDNTEVVYRTWSRRKQRWCYRIDNMFLLKLYWDDGHLKGPI